MSDPVTAAAAAARVPDNKSSTTTNNENHATRTTTTNATSAAVATAATAAAAVNLPDDKNRFELELEFVQALASPAYIHFLATTRIIESDDMGNNSTATGGDDSGARSSSVLQDPAFLEFLQYLRQTWTQPEYARFLTYPHCLFFLNLLIEKHSMMSKEWTLPQFRNFCHQQQFFAWQHRHAVLYGQGTAATAVTNLLQEEEAESGEAFGGGQVALAATAAAAESEGLTDHQG